MDLTQFLNKCLTAGYVYIAGHSNPDSDSVGSCFALALAMRGIGVEPVILLDKFSDKYSFLKGNAYVFNGIKYDMAPDVMVCLDCATKERLGAAETIFNNARETYNIDHHISNDLYASVNIVEPLSSSTCEVVYGFIKNMGVKITKDIAAALYTGIIGDTGSFKHSCVTPETHLITGELLRAGINFSDIQRRTLYEHSFTEARRALPQPGRPRR